MKIKLSENEWETVKEKRIKVKGQFKFSQIRKIKEERERKRESKERRGMRKKERAKEIKKEAREGYNNCIFSCFLFTPVITFI